jgi:hypothetical protein
MTLTDMAVIKQLIRRKDVRIPISESHGRESKNSR